MLDTKQWVRMSVDSPHTLVNGIARRSWASELVPENVKKIAGSTTIKSDQEYKKLKSKLIDHLRSVTLQACSTDEELKKKVTQGSRFSVEDAVNTFVTKNLSQIDLALQSSGYSPSSEEVVEQKSWCVLS